MSDIICLGILVADVIARPVDSYPAPGKLQLCDEMRPTIGGCAANTGIGLQKLGIETGVIGKVGRDGFGEMVRATLEENGLDVRGVSTDAEVSTSATMVMIASDSERSFIHYTGANATFTADDVDWSLMENAKLLHVAGHGVMPAFDGQPCADVLRRAKEMGLETALDTAGDASPEWMEHLLPTLPYIDYFVPSYDEVISCLPAPKSGAHTPQRAARAFLDEGVKVVALKMGEAGCYINDGQNEWSIPAFRVEAKDATGAGDAFAAGFLAGVRRGFGLEKSGRLGNATGACCVTQVGTVAGIRSLEETLEFAQKSGK